MEALPVPMVSTELTEVTMTVKEEMVTMVVKEEDLLVPVVSKFLVPIVKKLLVPIMKEHGLHISIVFMTSSSCSFIFTFQFPLH